MEHIMGGGGGASLVIETVYGHHSPLFLQIPKKHFQLFISCTAERGREGGIKEGFRNRAKYV